MSARIVHLVPAEASADGGVPATEARAAGGVPATEAPAERLLCRLRTSRDPAEGADARARLVQMHLHLVDTIAARYRGKGAEWDDLVQVGRLGLCKAIRGYRPGRGPSFVAYAVPTITGEIKRYFRDVVWGVRPPRRLQELQLELREHELALTQQLGHDPSEDELALAAGVEPLALREVRLAQQMTHTVSIDAPGDSGDPWSEALPAQTDDFAATEARLVLVPALRVLLARERRIVYLRFVRGWTQKEIGAALGISQMQVSRLLDQILTKLRERIVVLERAG